MSAPSRKQQSRQRKRNLIKVAVERHKMRLRSIQTCYEAEELAAYQDFEDKKSILHEKMELKINKKMRIVQNDLKEYMMKREMEDITDFLRSERRTILDSSPKPRRKPIVIKGPHIVYRLTDEEIEEDLKIIRKALRERELSPESRAAKERSDEESSDDDLVKVEEEDEGSDLFYPSPRYTSGAVSPKYTSGGPQDSSSVDYFVEYEPSGVVEMIEVPVGEAVLEDLIPKDESWIESERERWRPCCYCRAPDSCYVVKAPYLVPKVELGEGDGSEECREVPQLSEPLPHLVQPRVPLAPSTFPLLSSSPAVEEVTHDEWLCDNVALNVDLVTEGVYESE